MSVIPQFGVTVVAPALPGMAALPSGGPGAVQLVVTLYLAGFAVSVLLAGMLVERWGVRRTQLWALGLFVVASVVCAVAPTLPVLVAGRFVQALGGCAATVLARLTVRHVYPEALRVRTLSTLMAAIAVTPCLTPVLGGRLTESTGWRGVFVLMAVLGAVAAVLFLVVVPSGAEPEGRRGVRVRTVLADYAVHLRDPSYRACWYAISLASMAHVVFVTYSAHALGVGIRLTPTAYGGLVAVTALGAVAGAFAVRGLSARWELTALLRRAAVVCALGGVLLAVVAAAAAGLGARHSPWPVVVPMMVVMAGVGAVLPASQAGMLHSVGRSPGNASGLFFCLQQLASTVYGSVAGLWPGMTASALAVCVAVPCVLVPLAVRRTASAGADGKGVRKGRRVDRPVADSVPPGRSGGRQ
ncbi:MFS transporter [Streptomyces sp. CB02923]|uniref:MFS transporter n=1 Tax=Streptomyces sp. CB02923 TaxID=1718985 RepID=UPI001901C511|nr:MFS transporter [Streptomyces sp. CB02923]